MSLISYKPTTPSLRKTVKVDKTSLFSGRSEKSLTISQQPSSGRNNTGKITIRHRSGGAKKKYRIINLTQINLKNILLPLTILKLAIQLLPLKKLKLKLVTL